MLSNIKSEVQKGFTLIELLIVIAILAILTTIVVIVLNPAELLAQGRDSQRFSDMASLRTATSFWLKDRGCTTIPWAVGTAYSSNPTNRDVDGTGWFPVNFTQITGGSPLSVLPEDPRNGEVVRNEADTADIILQYQFGGDSVANTCGYEFHATSLESAQFRTEEDKNGQDGGDDVDAYEVGTDPGLDLL